MESEYTASSDSKESDQDEGTERDPDQEMADAQSSEDESPFRVCIRNNGFEIGYTKQKADDQNAKRLKSASQ
jgi:hypothetical protein